MLLPKPLIMISRLPKAVVHVENKKDEKELEQ